MTMLACEKLSNSLLRLKAKRATNAFNLIKHFKSTKSEHKIAKLKLRLRGLSILGQTFTS